jgi:hypothetical protein
VILHHIRFIEEMIREEGMATGWIQHHNHGKLEANFLKLDHQKLCKKFPTMERRILLRSAMGHIC